MLIQSSKLQTVSDEIGSGVFATEDIPKGTITWVRDRFDTVIRTPDAESLPEPLRTAFYDKAYRRPGQTFYLLCWDHAKYMNHSCDPNTAHVGIVAEVAIRDIREGDELTNDYGTFHMEAHECFPCSCGSENCREVLLPFDHEEIARKYGMLVTQIMQNEFLRVSQPLTPMFCDEHIEVFGLYDRAA